MGRAVEIALGLLVVMAALAGAVWLMVWSCKAFMEWLSERKKLKVKVHTFRFEQGMSLNGAFEHITTFFNSGKAGDSLNECVQPARIDFSYDREGRVIAAVVKVK